MASHTPDADARTLSATASGAETDGMSTQPPVSVLVVDDHEAFRVAAAGVLRRTDGFELVGEAVDGVDAVRQVEELRPRLVLMDVRMPGLDGIAATRTILARWPATRVILCSTYDLADLTADADGGSVTYVAKEELGPESIRRVWDAWERAATPPGAPEQG